MIIVTGVFEIAAEDAEAARVAMQAMVQETVLEDGCHVYEFSQVVGSDTTFRVYEEWSDLAALEAHFQAPHMQVFRAALKQIDLKSRSVSRFEAGPREML